MVLLTAHILNGKILGVEVPVNSIIDTPFKIEDTPSLGYADISSVINWWEFGRQLNRDYIFVRSEIKKIIEQKGIDTTKETLSSPPLVVLDGDSFYIDPNNEAQGVWAGYEGYIAVWDANTQEYSKEPPAHVGYRELDKNIIPGQPFVEKLIAARYKIGSQLDHFEDFGSPDIVLYGVDYHKQSIDCRGLRKLFATVDVYNKLPLHSAQILAELMNVPQVGNLLYLYEEWGIKGQIEDYNVDFNVTPIPGISDYIYARGIFDGSQQYLDMGMPVGLLAKNITTIDGQNMAQFCDELYSILVTDGVFNGEAYIN